MCSRAARECFFFSFLKDQHKIFFFLLSLVHDYFEFIKIFQSKKLTETVKSS